MYKRQAQDLYTDGIVEEIIAEPLGGAQRGRQLLFSRLDTAIAVHPVSYTHLDVYKRQV